MVDTDENAVNIETVVGVFEIPKHTVKLRLEATVYEGGELFQVEKELSMDDVKDAIRMAEDGYADPDEVYTLTDKGRRLAEEMEFLQDSESADNSGANR